jgi:hypothetical protein
MKPGMLHGGVSVYRWIVVGVGIVMTNDVGDANLDIDATYPQERVSCAAISGSKPCHRSDSVSAAELAGLTGISA